MHERGEGGAGPADRAAALGFYRPAAHRHFWDYNTQAADRKQNGKKDSKKNVDKKNKILDNINY